MTLRSDYPLIRHLCRGYGLGVGTAWQRLPYVEFLGMEERLRSSIAVLERDVPTLDYLLWDDAVFAFASPEPTWTRITRWDTYMERWRDMSPWLDTAQHYLGAPDPRADAVVVEAWHRLEGESFPHTPVAGVYQIANPWTGGVLDISATTLRFLGHQAGPALERGIGTAEIAFTTLAIVATAYLVQAPEYLVEETPEGAPVDRRARPSPKPWTDQYLPRIILLDPHETHRNDSAATDSGTQRPHASPRAHQRRGHWATLRHRRYARNPDGTPRRVFIRPAWIGPEAWTADGSHYRVIDGSGGTLGGER